MPTPRATRPQSCSQCHRFRFRFPANNKMPHTFRRILCGYQNGANEKHSDTSLWEHTTIDRSTPVKNSGLSGVEFVAAGQWHMAVVKWDGTVWAWVTRIEFFILVHPPLFVHKRTPKQLWGYRSPWRGYCLSKQRDGRPCKAESSR